MNKNAVKVKQPAAEDSQGFASKVDLWSHVGLAVTLLAGFLVILRLLAVSEWNQQTAMAILQQTGSAGILMGALLSILPAAIGMSLVFLGSAVPYRIVREKKRAPTFRQGYLLFMVILAMVLVAPVWNLILLGIGLVLAIPFGRYDRTAPTTGLNSNTHLFASVVMVPQAISLLTGAAPWIPREVVTFKEPGSTAIVGYVLKSDSDRLAILQDTPRSILYLQASTVKDRSLCGKRWWLGTTFISLISSKDPYAACPDAPKTPPLSPAPSTTSASPGPSESAASTRPPSATPSR